MRKFSLYLLIIIVISMLAACAKPAEPVVEAPAVEAPKVEEPVVENPLSKNRWLKNRWLKSPWLKNPQKRLLKTFPVMMMLKTNGCEINQLGPYDTGEQDWDAIEAAAKE